MKRSSRSKTSSTRCLFCYRLCSELDSVLDVDMVGAVHCLTLKKQLQNLFILRNILEIDLNWCEDTLRRMAEQDEEGNMFDFFILPDPEKKDLKAQGRNLEHWFKVCEACLEKVEEAWSIHQRLLVAHTDMNRVRSEMKKMMKEGLQKHKPGNYSTELQDEIRRMVIPEFVSGSTLVVELSNSDQFDVNYTMDHESPFSSNNEDSDALISSASDYGRTSRPGPRSKKRLRRLSSKKKRSRHKGASIKKQREKKYGLIYCPRCSFRFRDNETEKIQLHLSLHKKSDEMGGSEFDCSQCSFPAQDCVELDHHIRTRHTYAWSNRSYSCPSCDFTTKLWKNLREHADQNHEGLTDEQLGKEVNLLCPACPRIFADLRSLQSHKRSLHPELLGIEAEEAACEQCDLKFTSKLFLQSHINLVHKPEVHNRFICSDCGVGFQFLSKLEKHKFVHVNNREYVCKLCGVDYVRKSCFQKHMRKVHPPREEGEATASEGLASTTTTTPEGQFSCRYCDFRTPFRPALVKHTQTHKEELGHKCDQCGKSYTNSQGLARHRRINHSDITVACPYCNRKYPSVEYMKDHVKRFCKMKELREKMGECDSAGDNSTSKMESAKTISQSQTEQVIIIESFVASGSNNETLATTNQSEIEEGDVKVLRSYF